MRNIAWVICLTAGLATPVMAQINGPAPAELPPASFEGREYVDSRGCAFLRSTFGGEVTWIPRYGPDRQPICGAEPTVIAQDTPEDVSPPAEPVETAQEATFAPTVAPTPAPTTTPTTTPIRPVPQPVAAPAPRRAAAQPRRAPALPRADASGRHPSCPASAPYGQLVDTTLGRPLVRCVTSPALFLSPIHTGAGHDPHAPIALPDGSHARPTARAAPAARAGATVQVGSFAVPANATRLRARLQHAGLPARIHSARGLHVVTVGPFAAGSSAHSALSQVRRMGFSDAFLRR